MPEITKSKYMVMAGWDDAPHLDDATKQTLLDSYPPHERDARTKGIPSLGSGAIYPVPESEFVVDPFAIPEFWPRVYGLDVGWNRTAAIWGALDRSDGTLYLYTEHYKGQAEPSVHATAIRARGEWIPGVIDPASRGRGQRDGEQLLADYVNLGLKIVAAQNAREAGIYQVLERLSTGRIKIFKTCRNLLAEIRIYRRDEKGRIVKENDHLCDAMRYLVVSGLSRAKTKPFEKTHHIATPHRGDSSAGY